MNLMLTSPFKPTPSPILFLFALIALTQCSGKKDDLTYFETGDKLTLSEVISKARVSCDETKCPDNVMQLLRVAKLDEKLGIYGTVRQWGFAQCTAFVIDEQHVMTNAHCLGDEDPHAMTSEECSKNIGFVWSDGTTRLCSEVLYVAQGYGQGSTVLSSEDIAILKLDSPTGANPVKFNHSGLKDSADVHTWSVNPTSSLESEASLVRKTCEALQNHAFGHWFSHDKAPFFFLKDCSVIQGNSGSPLLNKDSEVVGIINSLYVNQQGESFAGGMNMACIDPSNLQSPWRSDLPECPNAQ